MQHSIDLEVTDFEIPVTIDFNMAPAEPDIGLMCDWVDEWEITHIRGKKVKKGKYPDWIVAMIRDQGHNEEWLLERLEEHAGGW